MTLAKGEPEFGTGGLGSLIARRPEAVFWGFLGLHISVWTLLPTLANGNLPLDVIEGLAWGREWQLGYAKHPPLSAWLLEGFAALGALLSGAAGGGVNWSSYLLSQVSVGVAFWAMWRLARDWLEPVPALLSVLLLEGIYYHNFTSPEFNANVVLLPFWALAILALWRALSGGGGMAWMAWGLCLALGALGKYTTALLGLSMAALVFADPVYRRQLAAVGPYLGLTVLAAVLAPHVWWLAAQGFPTFAYAAVRAGAGDASGGWWTHIAHPLRFLLGQLPIAVPALVMLLAAGRPTWRPVLGRQATLFLLFVGFGPLLASLLFSAILGVKLRSMWGTPLFLTSGVMLVGWLAPSIGPAGWRRFAWAWCGIFALAPAAYLGSVLVRPLFYDAGKRTQFPGRLLAEAVTAGWRDRFDAPLTVIVGDTWPAGNGAYYSPDRPSVYIDADPGAAPWLDDAAVAKRGAVVVWLGGRGGQAAPPLAETPLAALHGRLGPLEEQAPLSLPWQTWGDMPPQSVGWAIVPPQGGPVEQ